MHLRKEQLTLISLKVKKKMEPLLSDNYNPCNLLSLVNKIGYSCPILLWSSSPHLVCSNFFGSMVFHTLFGFSQNFWMAVLTRLLLGLFNGLHGPAKARCFSSMGWRISWIPLLHFHQLDLCSYIIVVQLNYVHTNRRNNLFFIYSIHFKKLLICLTFMICGCVVIGEFVAFLWFFCDLRILLWFCRFLVIWGFFYDFVSFSWFVDLLWLVVLGDFQICYCDLQVCCDLLIFYCDLWVWL
jgi:hypothetical protein